MSEKENYARDLSKGTLDNKSVNNLLEFMKSKGMVVEKLPVEILRKIGFRLNINFFECRGYRSWEGLVVTFPGKREDLTTRNVGTPFLRKNPLSDDGSAQRIEAVLFPPDALYLYCGGTF